MFNYPNVCLLRSRLDCSSVAWPGANFIDCFARFHSTTAVEGADCHRLYYEQELRLPAANGAEVSSFTAGSFTAAIAAPKAGTSCAEEVASAASIAAAVSAMLDTLYFLG